MKQESMAQQIKQAVEALISLERSDLSKAELMVVGCSTSEIAGGVIGQAGQPDLGRQVAAAILDTARRLQVDVAFQCCEHLNRALVVEGAVARRLGLRRVAAVPYPEAGGACASAAYRLMEAPVLVERVEANAGIDIGQTLIGMHLSPVVIPIRLPIEAIGAARITAARTRPPLIGGARARYVLEDTPV